MNELIEKIILSEELTNEQKVTLINRVVNASHNIDRFLVEGFYLRTEENKEENCIDVQLWYRNADPSGTLYHGNTNYNKDAILEFMKKTCLTNGHTK